MNFEFRFKQFGINHSSSSMKIGTDAVLLGALTHVEQVNTILEIGCGCGIISLMLAQRCDANIVGIDIHQNSVKQANENFHYSPWKNRLKAHVEDARLYQSKDYFDLIVSNPPYFSNSLKPDSKQKELARHNDRLNFSELCMAVCRNLSPKGLFWLILPDTIFPFFALEASKNELFCVCQIKISDNPNKPFSLIISSWSRNSCKINMQNLYIKNSDGTCSNQFKQLTSSFYIQKD